MKMKYMAATAATLCCGVILTLAAPRREVLARSRDVLSAAKFTDCTGNCSICETDGHKATESGTKNASPGSGWHGNCAGYPDCLDHQCDASSPSPEEQTLNSNALFREVGDAVIQDDEAALRSLLSHNPQRLHYVARRTAIQITACDGSVIAHYPISVDLAVRLAD